MEENTSRIIQVSLLLMSSQPLYHITPPLFFASCFQKIHVSRRNSGYAGGKAAGKAYVTYAPCDDSKRWNDKIYARDM
jgi:hypothetical protein